MPVSIVVGGQFGSEGKGKVAHYFARENSDVRFVVRCGGSNSGHTVIDKNGKAKIFQQLPTASILPDKNLAICAGSYIDLDIISKEIKETGLNPDRLFIDQEAVIITNEFKAREANGNLIKDISSTGSGTGAAVAARVNREKGLLFAKNVPDLKPFINDVSQLLRESLDKKERVLIEGTQGFGLSPLHSRFYPYTTSRDTTAAAFISETGLSPLDVDEVILTIRAFPIRVAGTSGPLKNEITWKQLTEEAGFDEILQEKASVTKKVRRVAKYDPRIVKRAILINRPTCIVLNHLDYIPNNNSHEAIKKFVTEIEKSIDNDIKFLGFGPDTIIEKKFMNSLMVKK